MEITSAIYWIQALCDGSFLRLRISFLYKNILEIVRNARHAIALVDRIYGRHLDIAEFKVKYLAVLKQFIYPDGFWYHAASALDDPAESDLRFTAIVFLRQLCEDLTVKISTSGKRGVRLNSYTAGLTELDQIRSVIERMEFYLVGVVP